MLIHSLQRLHGLVGEILLRGGGLMSFLVILESSVGFLRKATIGGDLNVLLRTGSLAMMWKLLRRIEGRRLKLGCQSVTKIVFCSV